MSALHDLFGVAMRRLGVLQQIDHVRTAQRRREELHGDVTELNARMEARTEAVVAKVIDAEQRIIG